MIEDFNKHIANPLFYTLPHKGSLKDIDSIISNMESDSILAATCLVFRVSSEFLRAADLEDQLFDRTIVSERVNLYIFFISYDIQKQSYSISLLTPESIKYISEDELLSRLCDIELNEIVRQNEAQALLYSENHHFETPSYRHASIFLRVGDLIQSSDIISALSFWLLKDLSQADGVMLDNWSIGALAIAGQKTLGLDLPMEALPEHPNHDRFGMRRSVNNFLRQHGVKRPLFIISVTSTGDLETFIKNILDQTQLDGTIRNLYAFKNAPVDLNVCCRLPHEVENYRPASCELCKKKSRVCKIDHKSFYIKDIEITHSAKLTARSYRLPRAFVSKYRGIGNLYQIHRDDTQYYRHNAFDINVKAMFNSTIFMDQFVNGLRAINPRPTVGVVPGHDTGHFIADIIKSVCGIPIILRDNLRRKQMNRRDLKAFQQNCSNILIADDVINSGRRIHEYNRSIREDFSDLAVRIDNITYFVALARPESDQQLDRFIKSVTLNHPWKASVIYIEKFLLPRWTRDKCPWCAEREMLAAISRKMALPPDWLKRRILQLVESDAGLLGEPLFLLDGVESRTLGAGSPLGDQGFNSTEIMFIIVSAMQQLRNHDDRAKRLDAKSFVPNMFDIANFVNMDEALLNAVMMRVLLSEDLGIRGKNSLRDLMESKLVDRENPKDVEIVMGEMTIAMARHVMSLFQSESFDSGYRERLSSSHQHFCRELHLI